MLSLLVFIFCYIGFVFFPRYKVLVSLVGGVFLIVFKQITFYQAFTEIHWNVIGLFIGTLFLAELFMYSKVPAVIAERLVKHAKTVQMALLSIFVLTSMISMFVENVAVVLLMAPVVLSLCEKLKISALKPLMLLAMFSNVQGTATLIGDPPSMIFGSYMNMSFDDFFFYQGKPSIFFIVQTGAISALLLAYWLFRDKKQTIHLAHVEKIKSWVPSYLLIALILILAVGTNFDKESTWLAGTTSLALGILGLIWQHYGPKWKTTVGIIKSLDWETTLFLLGLFILVGALKLAGWMDTLSLWIVNHMPANVLVMYLFIIAISFVISAFVDNIPYLIAMLPVIQHIVQSTNMPLPLLAFGLLVGACLGGNITPIGASANIAVVGFLEKHHYKVSYPKFMSVGLVFTLFAVIPASIVLWLIWAH